MWQRSYDGSPTLYLVPTPIGNMEDMTYRAVKVLGDVDVIFSEDTRVTQLLLNYYKIKNKLISLHNHNEDIVKEKVLEYLVNGLNVAIVTDRGTPIISDPGYKTVKYVSSNGFNVVALPGANAFVPALITSGLSPQHFLFYGFLDSKKSKKVKELEKLSKVSESIIFYEAPHRIKDTISLIFDVFGNREISLSREISKKFESVYRGNIVDLLSNFDNIKGEFVIVVSGYIDSDNKTNIDVLELVNYYVKNGLNSMDAIKLVAKENNLKKSDVYNLYHRGDK